MRNYFRYIRDENGKGLGAINVMEVNGTFRVGVSICAPSDVFSKKEARDIACNRTLDNKEALVFSFYEMIDNDWYDDFVSILPHREGLIYYAVETFFAIVDDVIMDYAREYYKSIRT